MDHVEQVTSQLSSYFNDCEPFPNCLYLYGQKSVGKSMFLKKFLESAESLICSVVVHAAECYVNKILFEMIVNTFNDHELSEVNNYAPFSKIDSIEDFLLQLASMDPGQSYLIVIENAEKLRDMDHNILPVFTKLQEFTGLNISCIFVSHIAFENFGIAPMIKIRVPDYTKNDIVAIFSSNYEHHQQSEIRKGIQKNPDTSEKEKGKQLEIAEKLDQDFYKNYLNIFLNVFYKACRDISELQLISRKCYPSYYAPVISGEIKFNAVTNLWRNITKLLKISLNTSYMRVENVAALEMGQRTTEEPTEPTKEQSNIRAFAQTLELPYYAKFLLIASFLASHNDAKSDKRLFMKHHGKERKRLQKAKVRKQSKG